MCVYTYVICYTSEKNAVEHEFHLDTGILYPI